MLREKLKTKSTNLQKKTYYSIEANSPNNSQVGITCKDCQQFHLTLQKCKVSPLEDMGGAAGAKPPGYPGGGAFALPGYPGGGMLPLAWPGYPG